MLRGVDAFGRLAVVALLALGLSGVPGTAIAQDTVVSAGFNVRFLSGTFGSDQTTRFVYAPAFLRVETDRFEVAGYFPYLDLFNGTVTPSQGGMIPMQGSLSSAPGVGMPAMSSGMMGRTGTPSSGQPSASVPTGAVSSINQSGIGDLVGGVGYRIVNRRIDGLQVVVGGRVKVPTASDARGLGTGRADLGTFVTVRKQLSRGWLYGEAGYLFIGNPPGADLRNAALWGVGAGRRLSDRVYLLASANGNTAILRQFGAPAELGTGLGFRLGDRTNVTILPSVGLSDASPRYAITVGLSGDVVHRR